MEEMEEVRTGVTLVGVPVDSVGMTEAMQRIEGYIAEGGFHQIATANVNFLVNALRYPALQKVLGSCDMVVADGMPLLWISKWLGLPLPERVPGVDMIPHLARLSAEHGYGIYLLGSSEASAQTAQQNLERDYPGVRIVGHHCPAWRPLDDMDDDVILAKVAEAKPDILLVGFGNPKQELWLARHRHELTASVCIGVGGSMDMLAGVVHRSPEKWQKLGLEWLFRMVQEPRRLVRRYAADFFGLVGPLTRQLAAFQLQGKRRGLNKMDLSYHRGATVAHLRGGLTAADCVAIEDLSMVAQRAGQHLLLDLGSVGYIGADALQRLIRIAFVLREGGSALWLTDARPSVRRVLRACRVAGLIRIANDREQALETIAVEKGMERYDERNALPTLHAETLLSHG